MCCFEANVRKRPETHVEKSLLRMFVCDITLGIKANLSEAL